MCKQERSFTRAKNICTVFLADYLGIIGHSVGFVFVSEFILVSAKQMTQQQGMEQILFITTIKHITDPPERMFFFFYCLFMPLISLSGLTDRGGA